MASKRTYPCRPLAGTRPQDQELRLLETKACGLCRSSPPGGEFRYWRRFGTGHCGNGCLHGDGESVRTRSICLRHLFVPPMHDVKKTTWVSFPKGSPRAGEAACVVFCCRNPALYDCRRRNDPATASSDLEGGVCQTVTKDWNGTGAPERANESVICSHPQPRPYVRLFLMADSHP